MTRLASNDELTLMIPYDTIFESQGVVPCAKYGAPKT
jgi:hypothetical protein